MAIVFDAAVSNQANAVTSNTISITIGSGANRIVFLGVQFATGTDVSGTPTCAGVPMTLAGSYSGGGGVFNKTYVYYYLSPATGSNNITVNNSGGANYIYASAASYAGVSQTGPIDVSAAATPTTGTSLSKSLTTTVDNDWLVGFFSGFNTGAALSAGASTTFRTTVTGGSWNNWGDSNAAKTPPGSYSIADAAASSEIMGIYAVALAPALGIGTATTVFPVIRKLV